MSDANDFLPKCTSWSPRPSLSVVLKVLGLNFTKVLAQKNLTTWYGHKFVSKTNRRKKYPAKPRPPPVTGAGGGLVKADRDMA